MCSPITRVRSTGWSETSDSEQLVLDFCFFVIDNPVDIESCVVLGFKGIRSAITSFGDNEKGRRPKLVTASSQITLIIIYYGVVIVFLSRITAVCANALPTRVEFVWNVMPVFDRMIPSIWEFVPNVAWPATCQKIFLA